MLAKWAPSSTRVKLGAHFANIDQAIRSEEHTSELQSHHDLVCRLLLEKKKQKRRKQVSRADGDALADQVDELHAAAADPSGAEQLTGAVRVETHDTADGERQRP